MAEITARRVAEGASGFGFDVTLTEAGDRTTHHVTLARDDLDRWGATAASPEEFVRRCFQFLLAREPKESILRRFDVREIVSYYPEFEREIRGVPREEAPLQGHEAGPREGRRG